MGYEDAASEGGHERKASTSQLLRDILNEEMRRDDAYEAAIRERLAIVSPVKFE